MPFPHLQRHVQGIQDLRVYFEKLEKIIKGKQTSSRVRFMIQDLIDLRKDDWKPRRDVAGPKTIDQIHKEVQQEKDKQKLDDLLSKPLGGGGRDSRDGRGGPGAGPAGMGKRGSRGQQQSQGEDGWTSVPSRVTRQQAPMERMDANKLRTMGQTMIGRSADVENISLGPPGARGNNPFTSWGKGSYGSRSQTKEDPASLVKPNRFAAFSAGGGSDNEDPRRSGASGRGPGGNDERARALQAVKNINTNGPQQQQVDLGGLRPGAPFGAASSKTAPAEDPAERQKTILKGQENLDVSLHFTA